MSQAQTPNPSSTPPLEIRIIPVTPLQQNCSLIWETKTMTGVFIDPGGEVDKLMQVADQMGVKVVKIWLTHGHLDHAGGTAALKRRTGALVEGPHKDDQYLLDSLAEQGAQYGMPDCEAITPDRYLDDGDSLQLGDMEFGVSHCPGHTPGHVVIHHKDGRLALVGDVIFRGSIGRTDFPKGNHAQLIKSITSKLWPLGNEMRFVPGHGPLSTFGEERRANPFVADHVLG